jgi:transglutaminase-like putative cysteine protease
MTINLHAMPTFDVRHLTRYRYRRPVAFGEHRMMVHPCEGIDQKVVSARIEIHPHPVSTRTVRDVFGNTVTRVAFDRKAAELTFESHVRVEQVSVADAAEADEQFPPPGAPFLYGADEEPDLARAIAPAHDDPVGEMATWARRFAPANGAGRVSEALIAMTGAIYEDFRYERRLFDGARAPLETLARRSGSCRDFAVLMMDAARRLGLAARFASGYLCASGGVGGGHTHAWTQVFLPSQGWLDFDPTNGAVGARGLIRVAVAVEPRQAVPLHGVWFGAASDCLGMEVEVDAREAGTQRARNGLEEFELDAGAGVKVALAG